MVIQYNKSVHLFLPTFASVLQIWHKCSVNLLKKSFLMDCRGTLVLITAETLVSVIFWFLSLSKSMQPYNAEGKKPQPLLIETQNLLSIFIKHQKISSRAKKNKRSFKLVIYKIGIEFKVKQIQTALFKLSLVAGFKQFWSF